MKKIDLSAVPIQTGSHSPPPFDTPCNAQSSQRLGRHAELALNASKIACRVPCMGFHLLVRARHGEPHQHGLAM
jgi:hypothetical protein